MNIQYEIFKKHMKDIERIIRFEDKLWDVCAEAFKQSLDCELTFPTLVDNVIDLLGRMTNDNGEWISYWVYELDCGKEYCDGKVVDSDGSIIKLETVDDLWNLLKKNEESFQECTEKH